MTPLKLIFAGTPDFAARHLAALLKTEHKVMAVYTQPDRPAGRGQKMHPSPVKTLALQHGCSVLQPTSLRFPAIQDQMKALQADLLIVVAYGLILPATILSLPRLGCINVHASLLPRWRGAAPIQAALLQGDRQTGISVMQMDEGLDTGDVLCRASCAIDPRETSSSLHDKLAELGSRTLVSELTAIAEQRCSPQPQDNTLATYAHKITKKHAEIEWTQTATVLDRIIRAYQGWPVAYTHLNTQRLRIWEAEVLAQASDQPPGTLLKATPEGFDVATGENVLRLLRLQLPGATPVAIRDVFNAHHSLFKVGCCFS